MLVLALLASARPARADESCAIVVAAQPEPDAAALQGVRQSFATRCRFVAGADVRAALERFDRPPPFEEQARDALAQAHAR
ncbi:MAG TPA: hypothetical protein VF945_21130, partial [Polyangia bacterium]